MTETPTQAGPRIPAGLALGQAVGQAQLVLTRPLYEALDPADIETTVRTLQDITSRAREL
jgi:hypothetical protein